MNQQTTAQEHPGRRERGFSLVEMVVAAGIAATVLTSAALVFGAVGKNQRRLSTYGAVEITSAVYKTYYGNSSGTTYPETVDCYTSPNYGRAAKAELMREIFWEDIANSTAVYCLGRNVEHTNRPTKYVPFNVDFDGRDLDTPEAFRLHLANVFTASSNVFLSWRGFSNYDHGSIFIMEPSSLSIDGYLSIRAIYDIDLKRTSTPDGTYASVKRYSSGVLTDYYDVFFPVDSGYTAFKPLFVLHERRARLEVTSGGESGYTDYKTAAEMPYYFIWWPDPAAPVLAKQPGVSSTSSLLAPVTGEPNPLPDYAEMAGRTSLFFTVPMFPAQQ